MTLPMSVRVFFNCSVACVLYKRKVKFLTKLKTSENIICKLFANNTNDELATLHSIATEQLRLSLLIVVMLRKLCMSRVILCNCVVD